MRTIFRRVVLILSAAALFLDGWAVVDFGLHPLATEHSFGSPFFRAAIILIPLPLTLLVAFLIIRRVPGNIVGPLLIVYSASIASLSLREEIGPIPFSAFYFYNMVFGWAGFFLMFIHFPDGRMHPPHVEHWIYRLVGITILLTTLTFLAQAQFDIPSRMDNPFFLPGLQPYAQIILVFGLIIFSLPLVMAMVSPFLRYRKASPLERQQIKWLSLFGGSIVLYSILGLILYPLATGGTVMNPGYNLFGMLFFILTGLFPPLAIGVSVLRYRLWEIDRIIRRTLVYSILSVILTLIYFGSVLVLRNTLAFLFQFDSNNIATVISTLAVAVLFTPLRRRVQTYIDLRFFRKKYDADQILVRFAAASREEVTIEPLAAALLHNVEETLQPEKLSLWIKSIPDKRV